MVLNPGRAPAERATELGEGGGSRHEDAQDLQPAGVGQALDLFEGLK
jgi:hypothetical protein